MKKKIMVLLLVYAIGIAFWVMVANLLGVSLYLVNLIVLSICFVSPVAFAVFYYDYRKRRVTEIKQNKFIKIYNIVSGLVIWLLSLRMCWIMSNLNVDDLMRHITWLFAMLCISGLIMLPIYSYINFFIGGYLTLEEYDYKEMRENLRKEDKGFNVFFSSIGGVFILLNILFMLDGLSI